MNSSKVNLEQTFKNIDDLCQQLWSKLENIDPAKPSEKMFTSKQMSDIYTEIYNTLLSKEKDYGQNIYDKFKTTHLDFLRKKVFKFLEQKQGLEYLEKLSKGWELYKLQSRSLQKNFAYLSRSYINVQGAKGLEEVSKITFFIQIVEPQHQMITEIFVAELLKDRYQQITERSALKNVADIILELTQTNQDSKQQQTLEYFTKRIELSSISYYQEIQSKWCSQYDVGSYLQNVKNLLALEEDLIEKCLGSTQLQKRLQDHFKIIFIQNYKDTLINSPTGLMYVLRNEKYDILKLIYQLYRNLNDKFDQIRNKFKDYIISLGSTIVNDKIAQTQPGQNRLIDEEFIENIITLHNKYNLIIQDFLEDNGVFLHSLREAFETFLNVNIQDIGVAEFLASYIDKIMVKEAKNQNEEETSSKIKRVATLFSYLYDKDLFITVYQIQLAKRLILDKSQNLDNESFFINKLKQMCGNTLTKNLEDMLKDINTTIDSKFQEILNPNQYQFQSSIKVLSSSAWPKFKEFNDKQVHPHFSKLQNDFENFYTKSTVGYDYRKLSWSNSLSSIQFSIKLDNNEKYECVSSVYMAQILFMFEDSNQFRTFNDIKNQLKFDDQYLIQVLKVLTSSKLLEKTQSTTKEVTNSDSFRFNMNYNEKRKKIVLQFIFTEEPYKREQMSQERETIVEATIVKIMKARKQLPFSKLVEETQSDLKLFKIQSLAVKKRIERLITLEYLARDQDDLNIIYYRS